MKESLRCERAHAREWHVKHADQNRVSYRNVDYVFDRSEFLVCRCDRRRAFIVVQVPDRGGRTTELQAPPPEMPTFQRGGSAGGGRRAGHAPQHHNQQSQGTAERKFYQEMSSPTCLVLGQRGGGWSARGGASGDGQFSGGYAQQQPYAMADPYAQQYSQMGYQGQQQIVNEYAGMDHSGTYGGRGRGGRGGRGGGGGGRRPR